MNSTHSEVGFEAFLSLVNVLRSEAVGGSRRQLRPQKAARPLQGLCEARSIVLKGIQLGDKHRLNGKRPGGVLHVDLHRRYHVERFGRGQGDNYQRGEKEKRHRVTKELITE